MNSESRSPSSAARWYALYIKPRHEKLTAGLLSGRGYTAFLPLYRSRRCWSDRIAEVELPLFPGYLFCHFDWNDRRTPVVGTPGVLQIVGLGRTPLPVEDREIEAIQAIIDSGLPAEPWPYLQAGTAVRIGYGSLAGLEGLLVASRKQHRLVVSVTLLQRSVAVEIDSAWVSPLRPRWATPSPFAPCPAR